MLIRLLQMTALTAAGVLPYNASANAVPVNVPYTVCSPNNALTFNSLKFDPNPPTIKTPFLVIMDGNLTKTINKGARVETTATLGSMPVSSGTTDLCEVTTKGGLPCPIAPGRHNLKLIVPIPPGVQIPPFVGVKVHIEAFNADNSKLFCIDTTVKFAP